MSLLSLLLLLTYLSLSDYSKMLSSLFLFIFSLLCFLIFIAYLKKIFSNSLLFLLLHLLSSCRDSHAGVYGDVQRVKILYNKKDSALIQMSDANQAQLGERL